MPPAKKRLHLVPKAASIEDIEITLLLEGVFRRFGFDFRDYARAPLRRRVLERMAAERAGTISALQEKVLRDSSCFERLVTAISSRDSILFRNPSFYRAFRREVSPVLRERKHSRMWHVGCASGAEVYSMAVVLHEERLLGQVRVYATEVHEAPLRQAAAGSFPVDRLRAAELSYRAAGGRGQLSDYYRVEGDTGVFRSDLRKGVVFASYNLGTDASFNEFDVILARDVMSQLGYGLQGRVHRLVYESLASSGFLGLGRGEDLRDTPFAPRYQPVDPANGLFRKVR
jgi:chemotaxis protein methyltransferase CheR